LPGKDKTGFVCPEKQVEGMLLSELGKNETEKTCYDRKSL